VSKSFDRFLPIADLALAPLVYPAAWLLKKVRHVGVHRLPRCKEALLEVGVFPIRDHYYEPRFDYRDAARAASGERELPGIDWNLTGQLEFLSHLTFADELVDVPSAKQTELGFHLNNGSFESGDAEYWYQVIRHFRPRRIFEIGSGNSTLMAIRAIEKLRASDPGYTCKHICVEPFEMPWLESSGVTVVRRKVEELDVNFFSELSENDILFIDSSHVIRSGGDVVYEFLHLLPTLNKGVVVHVHDIFSPRDYPKSWVEKEVRLWNEQYLLEAFLSNNSSWRIIGALNLLHHSHPAELKSVAPFVTPSREPGSFYIQKIA